MNQQGCQKYGEQFKLLKEKRDQLGIAFQQALSAGHDLNVFEPCQVLRDEIKPIVAGLREVFPGLTPEELRLMNQLEKDYKNSIETLKYYELLDAENGTTYTADYAEFAGKTFKVPSWAEVRARLTGQGREARQKLVSILEMQKKGNMPKLQLTPIGKTIQSLSEAIDAKKSQLMPDYIDTLVWEDLKDDELKYFPEEITVGSEPKYEITWIEAKNKSDVIRGNNGWLITIAETKPEMETDPEVAGETNPDAEGSKWRELSNGEKLVKYHTYQKAHNQTGLIYEDYLVAQMAALQTGQPLDVQNWTCLSGNILFNSSLVPHGRWNAVRVYLSGYDSPDRYYRFRVRGAVRA